MTISAVGRSLLLPFLLAPCISLCQAPATTLPIGTPLAVRIDQHLPMRTGQTIRAELIYPVYLDSKLILPEKTILTGTVVALRDNHSERIRARLGGDFTPFYIPVVSFNQITLTDGTTISVTTDTATDGAPIYRLVAPPPRKGGFIRQQFDSAIQLARDQIAVFTAPDKGDRILQFVYHQLPYHPQRIEKGTAWTVETAKPFAIPPASVPIPPPDPPVTLPASTPDQQPTWIIQAYLDEALSSATSKSGQPIKATVAEPIYNPDHTIAVPQGATMIGAVTKAKPAKRFGRAGALHFDFSQLVLPTGQTQNVQAALTGADSATAQKLAMDSEGEVKPKPQDKILIPLLLLSLAARPLDRDRDDGDNAGFGKNATASNSLGLVGFIIGTAIGSRNIAAGIGYYGAALSIYYRWIARGRQVTFAQDTRLVLQTRARRSAVLKPTSR